MIADDSEMSVKWLVFSARDTRTNEPRAKRARLVQRCALCWRRNLRGPGGGGVGEGGVIFSSMVTLSNF